ncbi:MAG: hypothetical protein ABEI97_04170 [Candidatus Nanohaloarchaea archaeon]
MDIRPDRLPRYAALLVPVLVAVSVAPRIVLSLLALVLVPGYVLSTALFEERWNRGVAAAALGAAMLAAAVYAADWLAVPVNTGTLAVYVLLFAAAYVYRGRPWKLLDGGNAADRSSLYLSGIAVLAVATWFLPVSGMHAPLFADPAVEGTLARLIAAAGEIPATWEPFAAIAVHHQPGFASITAAVHMVSGVPIPRVILVVGGLVHALFPLAVFMLADVYLERREAVVAGFIALLAAFPAYSFVAGMNSANLGFVLGVVLAAAAARFLRDRTGSLPVLALLATGTVLVHPLGLVVAGFLLLPEAMRAAAAAWNGDAAVRRTLLEAGAAVAGLPVLLSLPYYRPILGSGPAAAAEQFAIQSSYILPGSGLSLFHVIEPFYVNFLNWSGGWHVPPDAALLAAVFNPLASVLLIAAAITVYRNRRGAEWAAVVGTTWYVTFLLFSTVQAAIRVEFPLHSFIYPSRVKFLFAIPVAVLSAAALRDITVSVRGRTVPVLLAAVLVLSPLALLATAGHLLQLAGDPVVADTDRDAIAWLDRNVPGNAVVLNTVTDVEAGAFIGGPAQWIPAYTGNPVVFPATSITGDVTRLQDRRRFMDAIRNGSAETFQVLLDRYNVSYIYLSRNSMDGRGVEKPINPEAVQRLCSCPVVYGNEDVTVLATHDSR